MTRITYWSPCTNPLYESVLKLGLEGGQGAKAHNYKCSQLARQQIDSGTVVYSDYRNSLASHTLTRGRQTACYFFTRRLFGDAISGCYVNKRARIV